MAGKCGLNRNQIKYIAIVAMLIDHIAWLFVQDPVLGGCMHFIGRITGPIMAYFVAEGYQHTRDVSAYQRRLGWFALVSWPAFVYFENGSLFLQTENGVVLDPTQSMIFTLFLGLAAIRIWDSKKLRKPIKVLCVAGLCLLSCIGDWPMSGVLGCLLTCVYHDKPKTKWVALTLSFLTPSLLILCASGLKAMWFQFGVLLAPIILACFYNGDPGSKASIHKWFFYAFYPTHLLALGLIKYSL